MTKNTAQLKVYHGYGHANNLVVYGHVFKHRANAKQHFRNNFFANLLHVFKLFILKPYPFIKLEEQNLIDIVVSTINSAEITNREMSATSPNYVLDIIYSKNKKETFLLWLNEDTTSAMYKNKNKDALVHIASKKDTGRLNTLIFR